MIHSKGELLVSPHPVIHWMSLLFTVIDMILGWFYTIDSLKLGNVYGKMMVRILAYDEYD